MKDHPLIRITLLFIGGIIFQEVFSFPVPIIFYSSLILLLSSLILLYYLNKKDPTSRPWYISAVIVPLTIITLSALNYGLFCGHVIRYPFRQSPIRNSSLDGTIESVELNRSYEFRMTVTAGLVIAPGRRYDNNYQLVCRIRDENKAALEELFNRVKPGNKVHLKGTLSQARTKRNPGEFDFQNYFEQRGICATFTVQNASDVIITDSTSVAWKNEVFRLRKNIYAGLLSLHDYQTASLLKGLLLADRSDISSDTENDFINTGVVHVMAVSGLHVVYIMMIFYFFLGRLNFSTRSLIIIPGLIFYLLLTGLLPSVLRAVLMAIILIIAYLTNRSSNIYNALSLSALLILIASPRQVFDPGFQLSYASVLSIALLAPFFKRRIDGAGIKNHLFRQMLLFITVSVAAQIGTMPFTLYYFGKLSLVAILANIIIIPLSGLIIALGILTVMLYPFSFYTASVFALVNMHLTDAMYRITHWLSSLPFSFLMIRQFSLSDAFILLMMAAVFFCYYEKMSRPLSRLILSVMSLVNTLLLCSLDDREIAVKGYLTIIAADVSQGDAALVFMPDGTTLLIDAGQANRYFDTGESVLIPLLDRLGVERVDIGFISHLDSDHYSGFISLIQRERIKRIIKPVCDTADAADRRLEAFLKKRHVPFEYYSERIIKCGGARIYLPVDNQTPQIPDRNDRSGIIKITYGETDILFTGDATARTEGLLCRRRGEFLSSEILKVAHHGSPYSTSEEFLRYVRPHYALISSGAGNRFNFPSDKTLSRLRSFNARVFRTDKSGAVILRSDGSQVERIYY